MSSPSRPVHPFPSSWWPAPDERSESTDGRLLIGRGPIFNRARWILPIVVLLLVVIARTVEVPETPVLLSISDDTETLEQLERAQIPVANLEELARRLGNLGGDLSLVAGPGPVIGDTRLFWISNMHGDRFQIRAELALRTAHAYFWVQNEVETDEKALSRLGRRFDEQIHPNTMSLLGAHSSREDPEIHMLFSSDLGPKLAGYFSPQDLLHPAIGGTSNGLGLLVMNSDLLDEAEEDPASLLAHEFQHLIHWGFDPNESAWIQEGFSELAKRLGGFGTGARELAYLSQPDLQLNSWPLAGDRSGHYGASSLFLTYLHNRFGPMFTVELARHPSNGLEGLDSTLEASGLRDRASQRLLTSEDVVMDWALANYLQPGMGLYSYAADIGIPSVQDTEVIKRCSGRPLNRDVNQYGADYIRVTCTGTLEFEGASGTRLLPTRAKSGEYFFWSNRADQADTKLTRSFDLSGVTGPITLRYWTWFDIEKGWDYLYLLASEDGRDWQFLQTPSGTDKASAGISYGWGYTGVNRRNEWSRQIVDLSRFAGKQVVLRFEYVTDAARTGEGFLIDDLSIPQIGYSTDFEQDSGGWEAEGFVRVRNVLPQSFRLSLIRLDPTLTIERIHLNGTNRAAIPLDDAEQVVLVVMGTARHTRQPAEYKLTLSR